MEARAQTTNIITSASPDAINQALQNGGVISLQFSGDVVLDTTLFVAVTNGTVLDATGFTVTLDGSGVMPILTVPPGLSCTIKNVGFINGRNLGFGGLAGPSGGTLSNGNGQAGGQGGNGTDALGGAILNQGSLTLINCLIGTNSAIGGAGGPGGNGGNGNFEGGAGGNGGNGGNGFGGGIYNDVTGSLILSNCTVIGNNVVGSNGGAGGTNGTGGIGASPGNGGAGGSGSGAGIYSLGALTVWNSTFASNSAVSGASQPIGAFNNGRGVDGLSGPSSFGAGIYNQGTGAVINCTFSTNVVVGGTGGNGGPGGFTGGNGGNGGNGSGGALYNAGILGVTNCTIFESVAIGGTNGAAGSGGTASGQPGSLGLGLGNDIANSGITFLLKNSLITNFAQVVTGAVAYGTIVDGGNNLSSDSTPAFSASSSHNNTNPRLGPLANNGGPTLTMILVAGSPAIGHADPAAAPPFDQRGYARGPHPDIGAYQSGASSNASLSISGTVTTDGTTPVPGISVNLSGLGSSLTDTNGRYTFGGLVSNLYFLSAQPSGFFSPADLTVSVGPTNALNANFVGTPLGRSNINGFATAIISTNSTRSNRIIEFSFNVLTNSFAVNRAYYLLASTNLANPTNWQFLATNVPSGTNLFTLNITNQVGTTNYFFSIPITNGFTNSPMLFLRSVTQ